MDKKNKISEVVTQCVPDELHTSTLLASIGLGVAATVDYLINTTPEERERDLYEALKAKYERDS